MNFIRSKQKTLYLQDTSVENIFINEYLPAANGDYVKVYVYGLMYAESGMEMTNRKIAEQFGISEKIVNDAWAYWENLGAVKVSYPAEAGAEPTITFTDLKELMYGQSGQEEEPDEPEEPVMTGEARQAFFREVEQALTRPLSTKELGEILTWVDEEHLPAEVVLAGVRYSMKSGKDNISYIAKVVRGWVREGLFTKEAVDAYLEQRSERWDNYRRIVRELGLTRNATEPEKRMMDHWFDELGYSMPKILTAIEKTTGISNPSFKYVNAVLENWKEEADRRGDDVNEQHPVTQAVLQQYYRYLRQKEEKEAEARRAEAYGKIPRLKELDAEERQLSAEAARLMLSGAPEGREAADKLEEIAMERAFLLTENNYPMDYMEVRRLCEKCADTGITDDGLPCSCMEERRREAGAWKAAEAQSRQEDRA